MADELLTYQVKRNVLVSLTAGRDADQNLTLKPNDTEEEMERNVMQIQLFFRGRKNALMSASVMKEDEAEMSSFVSACVKRYHPQGHNMRTVVKDVPKKLKDAGEGSASEVSWLRRFCWFLGGALVATVVVSGVLCAVGIPVAVIGAAVVGDMLLGGSVGLAYAWPSERRFKEEYRAKHGLHERVIEARPIDEDDLPLVPAHNLDEIEPGLRAPGASSGRVGEEADFLLVNQEGRE